MKESDPEFGKWSHYDAEVAAITDRVFVQRTFYIRPSIRSKKAADGWFQSRPDKGEPFDESEWTLVPGGWDHEHCSLCFSRINDGMNYWSNGNEITILCDQCYDHYKEQLSFPQ
jgi:hypothetical protein